MLNNIKKFSLPEVEEKVLDFWKKNKIFQKVQDGESDEEYIFYEGPPTANGRPGIHHVLSRSFKDVCLRFQTMLGKHVLRRGGWDTHGLPVELEIEKNLGLNSKPEIEEYGVSKFNKKCKESVWKYRQEWENLTNRMGFWIDMEHPYITYENSYIETLWWIFSCIEEAGLLYKGKKVVPWCSRCGTALSSHELAQGYETVVDESVTAKFQITNFKSQINSKLQVSDDIPIYILSWTTTPWTLPGNVALAIGEQITYVIIKTTTDEYYVLAKDRVKELFKDEEYEYEVIEEIEGKDLIGLEYKPLFEVKEFQNNDKAYKIYPADFVTTEDGTGVVHTAVMYGEDDYRLGEELGLPKYHTVGEDGRFGADVPELEGLYVKSEDTEEKIFSYLAETNTLLKTEKYEHEYPFCWRCDTHVLYFARESWFVEMSVLRENLLEENEKINWTPAHIKEGRFGEWLRGVKDWAISRERYWGTPLPIWECDSCDSREVPGGFKEISNRVGGLKNNYIFLRHGEAEHNVKELVSTDMETQKKYLLTKAGMEEAQDAAERLKEKGVDMIFSSDFERTKQTSDIVSDVLGLEAEFDSRLREINTGKFDEEPNEKYHLFFKDTAEKFEKTPPKGENLNNLSGRIWDFISEMEDKHDNKTVLVISHEYPIWMARSLLSGWGREKAAMEKDKKPGPFVGTAEIVVPDAVNLPRDKDGFVDPHRPFIDEVEFECEQCDGTMRRIDGVADVWFDSGAMPWAQMNFPFAQARIDTEVNTDSHGYKNVEIDKLISEIPYPADYIVEGMDQTRGWFYTLLAVSSLLGLDRPYKNVISLGLVLDEDGKKMSKSRGNAVDPWKAIDKWGTDVIRWYFFTANSPGEPIRFDEEELKKVLRRFVLTAYNSLKFLNIYADEKINLDRKPPENVLDRWILSRLCATAGKSKKLMEDYNMVDSARLIEEYALDLSKWYIRRSRDRFQNPDNPDDYNDAAWVLSVSLLGLAKMSAPFVPFLSEFIYQSLKDLVSGYNFKESVHMENYPDFSDKDGNAYSLEMDEKLEQKMAELREIASIALAQRDEEGIRVRQPLSKLYVKSLATDIQDQGLLSILKDEVNAKEVEFIKDIEEKARLDTEITPELMREGQLRDLVRRVQSLRAKAGLDPGDPMVLGVEADEEILELVDFGGDDLRSKVGAKEIQKNSLEAPDTTKETKVAGKEVRLTLRRS